MRIEESRSISMSFDAVPLSSELQRVEVYKLLGVAAEHEKNSDPRNSKELCDTREAIVKMGSTVLPFIKEFLLSDKSNEKTTFAEYVSWMAVPEDINFIVDSMLDPVINTSLESLPLALISMTATNLNIDLRKKGDFSEVLDIVARKIISLLEKYDANDYTRNSIEVALASTGTKIASEYFDRNPQMYGWNYNSYKRICTDINYAEDQRPYYSEFQTWDDLLKIEEECNEESAEWMKYAAEIPLMQITSNKPFNELLPEEIQSMMDRAEHVNSIFAEHFSDVETTVTQAAKLMIYNYLKMNPAPTKDDLSSLKKKISYLSTQEKLYKENYTVLPTVGIEVEFLRAHLEGEARVVADVLAIPNYQESYKEWETNPYFSYNPFVQSRIVMELSKLGAFRVTQTEDPKKRLIPEEDMHSMHINFGMAGLPEDLVVRLVGNKEAALYREDVEILCDVLTYAFVSENRILNRKSDNAYEYKSDAEESEREPLITDYHARLELRTFEFKDFPSFILLPEAQRLTAMYFAHIKVNEHVIVTETERKLAGLWMSFKVHSLDVLNKYTDERLLYDDHGGKKEAATLLMEKDIKIRCRELCDSYSKSAFHEIETSEK